MSSNRKKQVQAKAKACILTLEQRLEIIEKLTHQSVAELAREYQVAQSTIWRIKKNEAELLRRKEVIKQSSGSLKKKRYNSVNDSKLEEKLYKWFKQLRSAGVTIDGPLIQQKALEFNEKLSGDPQFQASNGWLCAFKARHRIRELSVQGEQKSANVAASQEFKQEFNALIDLTHFDLNCVYNADETGLFWRLLPNKTLATRDEKTAVGWKIQKSRVTIMCCTNATGTQKIPLYMIGKSKQPRCFNGVHDLPVYYTNQESAWMVRELMFDWFDNVFIPAVKIHHNYATNKTLKIILILDNAGCHPSAEEFNKKYDFCTVIYLPPNVTSLIQPMDQGVIAKFKRSYKKLLLQDIIRAEAEGKTIKSAFQSLTLLHCCQFSAAAWNDISADTIRQCWKNLIPLANQTSTHEVIDTVDMKAFNFLLQQNADWKNITPEVFKEWMELDADEPGWQLLTDEEILGIPQQENIGDESMDIDNTDEIPSERENQPIPTALEAYNGISTALRWLCANKEGLAIDIESIKSVRDVIMEKAMLE